jgi:DNA-binding protein Fis
LIGGHQLSDRQPPAVRAAAADTVPTTSVERPDFVALLIRFVDSRLQAGSTNLHDEVFALVERHLVLQVLRHTGGNQSQAARILGLARRRCARSSTRSRFPSNTPHR